MTKKILDVDTTKWSEKNKKKIESHLRKYKYQVNFKLPDGKIRFAYTNDEPEVIKDYMKMMNATILKVKKL